MQHFQGALNYHIPILGWCYGSVLSTGAAHPLILGSTPPKAHCSQNCNGEGSRNWSGGWTT